MRQEASETSEAAAERLVASLTNEFSVRSRTHGRPSEDTQDYLVIDKLMSTGLVLEEEIGRSISHSFAQENTILSAQLIRNDQATPKAIQYACENAANSENPRDLFSSLGAWTKLPEDMSETLKRCGQSNSTTDATLYIIENKEVSPETLAATFKNFASQQPPVDIFPFVRAEYGKGNTAKLLETANIMVKEYRNANDLDTKKSIKRCLTEMAGGNEDITPLLESRGKIMHLITKGMKKIGLSSFVSKKDKLYKKILENTGQNANAFSSVRPAKSKDTSLGK